MGLKSPTIEDASHGKNPKKMHLITIRKQNLYFLLLGNSPSHSRLFDPDPLLPSPYCRSWLPAPRMNSNNQDHLYSYKEPHICMSRSHFTQKFDCYSVRYGLIFCRDFFCQIEEWLQKDCWPLENGTPHHILCQEIKRVPVPSNFQFRSWHHQQQHVHYAPETFKMWS